MKKVPTARSAPLASPDTPALCLLGLPTTRIIPPDLFIVAPPGPRHGRSRHPLPSSAWTTGSPPYNLLDQSP
jgi:hypothetical protein